MHASLDPQLGPSRSGKVVVRRMGLILSLFIVIFGLAAGITYTSPRKFGAEVEWIDAGPTKENTASPQPSRIKGWLDRLLRIQPEIADNSPLLERVAQKLDLIQRWNLPTKEAALRRLEANLEARSPYGPDTTRMDYFDEDPRLAADIVNAVADGFRDSKGSVSIIRRAEPEMQPRKPNLRTNLALGAAVALLFGLAVAYFFESMEETSPQISPLSSLSPHEPVADEIF